MTASGHSDLVRRFEGEAGQSTLYRWTREKFSQLYSNIDAPDFPPAPSVPANSTIAQLKQIRKANKAAVRPTRWPVY
jgi:hypothetical protein